MKIFSSKESKKAVAEAISMALEAHKNTDILLLLAGGSALKVLDEVDTTHINEYVTIMMMDERYTKSPEENNFLQMTKTIFFTKLTNSQCNFLPSVPYEGEKHVDFSNRIEKELTRYIETHAGGKILALFGIGLDGHTAGIFPMQQEHFVDTYGQGNLYTQVVYDKNPITHRATITPKFIEGYITESFIYAVGEEKLSILSTITDPYELHEMPAHIHNQTNVTLFTNLILQ